MKIILMMAVTADGKIARSADHFPDWTSKEDKKMFAETTKKVGVAIFGENTFRTFLRALPERLNVVFTLEKNPPKQEGVKWVSGEPEKILKDLEDSGYKSAILGGGAGLNSQFLEKGLIDEIWLTIEPKIFGEGLGVFSKELSADLKLLDVEKINDDSVVLKYEVVK
ncbi:MAG: dihydrofolate reductase family protein [Candidatus Moranbacteria bacterium]|nr:dihydrofolate reductase family protein [Candidatus Moranbacteria bacterium]